MPSRRFWSVTCAVLAGALVAWLVLTRVAGAPVGIGDEELMPVGRWHRLGDRMTDDDDLARTLSLPYLAGKRKAGGGSVGVLRHDPERAWQGVNLYVSGHAPEALLIDMDGKPLHRWQRSFEQALPERRPSDETGFFRRARMLPGGDLLVLYQGGGLARLDHDSEVVWSAGLGAYNDLFVHTDGEILVLTKEARPIPGIARQGPVLEDSVTRLDRQGRVVGSTSLLQAVLDAGLGHLLRPDESADLLHSNTVTMLDEPPGGESTFGSGRVLVSMREIDLLAALDETTGRFTWTLRGHWRRQHEPVVLADGRILLFDNRGAGGKTRLLEIDPSSGEILLDYRGPEERPLASPEAGSVARLANGNTLITDSERGRALEVTPAGAVVWEFESPHRAGTRGELVATLFEVVRLPAEAVDWLDDAPNPREEPAR